MSDAGEGMRRKALAVLVGLSVVVVSVVAALVLTTSSPSPDMSWGCQQTGRCYLATPGHSTLTTLSVVAPDMSWGCQQTGRCYL